MEVDKFLRRGYGVRQLLFVLERREIMSAITLPERSTIRDARFQAYALLWIGFSVAPILFGLDKFFDVLVDWPVYLAPWVDDIAPGSAQDFMYVVGAVEIVAGLTVALKPRYGAYLVAAWLAGIIVNLLSHSGYYDIALRDFGLLIGALALARLAAAYDPPLRRAERAAQ
jgi:hypothetical protein